MGRYIKEGWKLACSQTFAIGVLFLFHLLWAHLFYRFLQGRVVEVMKRLPPPELGAERFNLFLNESILLLQKTDLAVPVLWTLLVYVAVKLLLTPALHAGVYWSLHETQRPRGTIFIEGMRRFGGSFTSLYLLRLALTAVPLYWVIPALLRIAAGADSALSLIALAAPWLIGFAIYGGLLKLLFTYLLFALIGERSLLAGLSFSVRRAPFICGLALLLFGIAAAISVAVYTASFYWAGFLAVMLYLAYPLCQILFRIWSIAAQHRYWRAENL